MYTIEISRVKNGKQEFVVGCEFPTEKAALQVFFQIDNEYHKDPAFQDGEILVDLWIRGDLCGTVVTDEKSVKEIDERFFQ